MTFSPWKFLLYGLVAAAVLYGVYQAVREQPILVDVATVDRGPMTVPIVEEGVARVRDVYAVSAPIAGHLDRAVIELGQSVKRGEPVAHIEPMDPPLLDARTRSELQAAVQAAEASVSMAKVDLQRATVAMEVAKADHGRAQQLEKSDTVSPVAVERAFNALKLAIAQVESAQASVAVREAELESAKARLRGPELKRYANGNHHGDCCIPIASPVDGVVLELLTQSEQPIQAGTQIAEIGDITDLEIEVDLLSSDAMRLKPGSRAVLRGWGAEGEASATVRRINPAAFTKVSALGIAEQRVNVLLDPDDTPDGLGHGYQVLVELIVWESDDVLQVPISALFRSNGSWAAFVVDGDRVAVRMIELGRMNDTVAQVLRGLEEGQPVVLFPNDQLEDGGLIARR